MYLTPESITAALAACLSSGPWLTLNRLECTRSRAATASNTWNVYTSDAALVFTGDDLAIWTWLRNSDPTCTFAELSPMRRDRLVAAFVSPGRDLLGGIRKFAAEHGFNAYPDADHVAGIWSFARHAGWSYLETLEDPASVAREALSLWREALSLWRSQDPGDED